MIPLNETEFDFEAINDQIIGAGILPISVDDRGDIRLLLGKERFISHWRGSLKWSGFEGGRKTGEDVVRTAAREFIEESIGIVKINGCTPTIDSVVKHVEAGKYVARIVLCIVHGDNHERRYHVTYLIEVPYDTEYTDKFLMRRRTCVDVQARTFQLTKLRDEVVRLQLPIENGTFNSYEIAAILRAESVEDRVLRVEFMDSAGAIHVYELDHLEPSVIEVYIKWYNVRMLCTQECSQMECQDAITVQMNPCHLITSAKVNEDFIEKQHVQWWTVNELRDVLKNGGYMQSEFFRAYFLPVLQRTIEEVDAIVRDR